MESMTQYWLRWFRGELNVPAPVLHPAENSVHLQLRHSTGLSELDKFISSGAQLSVLDMGATSSQNILRLTGMGHRVASEDVLLASLDPAVVSKDAKGKTTVNIEPFLTGNLQFHEGQFDAVLCWDVPDYMPEPLVRPMIECLHHALKPGGQLLAFFHTEGQGTETAYYRYHISGTDRLEMKRGPQYPLQRVFHNRHIEKLFKDFNGLKFFLARDHVREVLVTR